MTTPNEAAPVPAPVADDAKNAKPTPSDSNNNPAASPNQVKTNDDKLKMNPLPGAPTPNNTEEKEKSVTLPKPTMAATSPKNNDEKEKGKGKEKEENSGAANSITGTPSLNGQPGAPPPTPTSGVPGTAQKASTPVSGQTLPNSHALALANAKSSAILCINPNKAVFATTGGVSKHLMINKCNDRLAIKIRSSNNFFFRVNPVYSFLDGNSVNELEVIRLNGGGAKQDKLQLIYVICSETDTDPTKLFGLRARVRSVILPITTALAS